ELERPVLTGRGCAARAELVEGGGRAHEDSERPEVLADQRPLQGRVGEGRYRGKWGDDLHLVSLVREQLGQADTDNVALAVVDDDAPAGWALAVEHDLLRSQDVGE